MGDLKMATTDTDLCIGGPLDGKLLAHNGERYCVKLLEPMPTPLEMWNDDEITRPIRTKAIWYVRDMIRSSTGRFTYWRPEDQSVHETIELLFCGYSGMNALAGKG